MKPSRIEPLTQEQFARTAAQVVSGGGGRIDADMAPHVSDSSRKRSKKWIASAVAVVAMVLQSPTAVGIMALTGASVYANADSIKTAAVQMAVGYQTRSAEQLLSASMQMASVNEAFGAMSSHFSQDLMAATHIQDMLQSENYIGAYANASYLAGESATPEQRQAVSAFQDALFGDIGSSLLRNRIKSAIDMEIAAENTLQTLLTAIQENGDFTNAQNRQVVNDLTMQYRASYRDAVNAYDDLGPLLRMELERGESVVAQQVSESLEGIHHRWRISEDMYMNQFGPASHVLKSGTADGLPAKQLSDLFSSPLRIEESFSGGASKLSSLLTASTIKDLAQYESTRVSNQNAPEVAMQVAARDNAAERM